MNTLICLECVHTLFIFNYGDKNPDKTEKKHDRIYLMKRKKRWTFDCEVSTWKDKVVILLIFIELFFSLSFYLDRFVCIRKNWLKRTLIISRSVLFFILFETKSFNMRNIEQMNRIQLAILLDRMFDWKRKRMKWISNEDVITFVVDQHQAQ